MKKILIIRLSSFGDIVQCLSSASLLKQNFPSSYIYFLTKREFSGMAHSSPDVDKVIEFDKITGMLGFIKLVLSLKKENFDLVYDAHLNLRTLVLKLIFFGLTYKLSKKLIIRPKHRLKRFFLFFLRIDLFKEKFYAKRSFLKPIYKHFPDIDTTFDTNIEWSFELKSEVKTWVAQNTKSYIALVLGANWELKRWPKKSWENLIALNPDKKFVLLGASLEEELASVLEQKFKSQVVNFVKKLSLTESCEVLLNSIKFISTDTGMLHVADSTELSGYGLLGPTAFGYPSSSKIKVLEDLSLKCRPCSKDGRGRCSQKVYKQCMVNLTPEMIHL